MKQPLSAILIIVFGSIALFSLSAISHVYADGHHNCIAATFGDAMCPDGADTMNFIGFHFNAFKIFSSAVFNSGLSALLLVCAALLTLASLKNPAATCAVIRSASLRQNTKQTPQDQIRHWLSLHENSPAIL
ncbi:MAG: hypothetical protein HZC14_02350 [Candidatus Niyogibacteria bacterium]|nr:hypothetical protein [Candidatus Niyogibacteria bacterium]